MLTADIYQRAIRSRDPRFDGIFFVAVTTTGIYCRPVCPSRGASPRHRRFFETAAAAEHAGFRPCLRCRPELAPGRSPVEAVPRLARVAAYRIAAGALNGRGVPDLARELGVSPRHLRRALEREVGVSPLGLAQTHRLLLAKRLLAETRLPVTRIAFASGFQSLRRFNAVFRERYQLSPSALRPRPRTTSPESDMVRLTLSYRQPLAWDVLATMLGRDALPGVEFVRGGRYGRTVSIDGKTGVVFAADSANVPGNGRQRGFPHLNLDVSTVLLPVLMPLLARLRQQFDLDAEPTVVDNHLEQGGLAGLVRRRPGIRLPGAGDAFEAVLRVLLFESGAGSSGKRPAARARRIVHAFGEPFGTGHRGLTHLTPTADRIAGAAPDRLVALGMPRDLATALTLVARALARGELRLDPGSDADGARRALLQIDGIDDRLATLIVMRALHWPDAFPAGDPAVLRAAHAATATDLLTRAERWRPWRAYAFLHLRLHDADSD